MRLVTLCLGIGAFFLSTTVLAQELIAPEEWFESMKIAQGLVARHDKRHSKSSSSRQHRLSSRHHHHTNKSNRHSGKSNKKVAESSPRLAKRRWGYPSRREIEHRATEFNSFRADEIVHAPAELHIVKEPMVSLPAGVAKIEKEAGTKKVKKVIKKAAKKVIKKAAKKVKQHEKRHHKVSSSSKDRHSHAKKTSEKKASSPSS
ncbi:hypothetical protein BGZ95_002494 [Linnemannia exigua]|uniref:Uncharacterized protein n=1 Tax=Linnemannia exigua TaxID=604196 RepID=A0AAD4D5U8_9FUNG|nr:hypothetical protein BGZ95_002494 [Linnemannia exigua]